MAGVMTKYKLPDLLGGGEFKEAHIGTGGWVSHVVVQVPMAGSNDAWFVLLPKEMLTEVKPPLPPEPPDGSVVLADGDAWLRADNAGMAQWHRTGSIGTRSWERICEMSPNPQLLIPAPEPVTLPWVLKYDDAPPMRVERSTASNRAAYIENWGHLTAAEAREMARALWTAAEEFGQDA